MLRLVPENAEYADGDLGKRDYARLGRAHEEGRCELVQQKILLFLKDLSEAYLEDLVDLRLSLVCLSHVLAPHL